jgi:methylaspartate ammonia-lyase
LSYFCYSGLEIEYNEAGDQVALVNATVLAARVNKNMATELLEHEMDGPAPAKLAKWSEAEIEAKLLAAHFHFTYKAALMLAEKLSAIASTTICVSWMSPSAMHRVQG